MMNQYRRGQTYNQKVEILKSLLKVFGRLDPPAAARTLEDMTTGLLAEIQEAHPACAVDEVWR